MLNVYIRRNAKTEEKLSPVASQCLTVTSKLFGWQLILISLNSQTFRPLSYIIVTERSKVNFANSVI